MASNSARPVRRTRRSVLLADRISTIGITVGGVAVLGCVLGIVVYLLAVVLPLFRSAHAEQVASFTLLTDGHSAADVLFFDVDEYRSIGTVVFRDGQALGYSLADGTIFWRERLFPAEPRLVASSRSLGDAAAVAFADGTGRLVSLRFEVAFLADGDIDDAMRALEPGQRLLTATGVVERTLAGDLRRTRPAIDVAAPVTLAPSGAIRRLDYRVSDSGSRLAVLLDDGRLTLNDVIETQNFMTGEVVRDVSSREVTYEPAESTPADHMLLSSNGRLLYLAWNDGAVGRYSMQGPNALRLDEHADVLPDPEARLTTFRFLPGEQSLLVGDDRGAARVWFAAPNTGFQLTANASVDGKVLSAAHELRESGPAITTCAVSSRDRTVLVGDSSGSIALTHVTSSQSLLTITAANAPIRAALIAPKADAIVILSGDGVVSLWTLDNPHPEASFVSLFGSVWYEGYGAPDHAWQSSGATDDFEPKLGLVPLIYGSLKATFYSLLLAVPIAILAAIYTSEFLDRRLRSPVKSTIEMMASLPSVVLGFIGALVLAPIVEGSLMAILVVFALVPLSILAAGYLWQLLPPRLTLPLAGPPQLLLIALIAAAGVLASRPIGELIEHAMFAGDFRAWLDGRHGGAEPGIALLAAPTLFLLLLAVDVRWLAPAACRVERTMSQRGAALLSLGRFVGLIVVTLFSTWLVAEIAATVGFDPRGSLVATYVQRNALVVGFVMGFAVIPIIYTIADDSLQAVPSSLRSASLGCGATTWQTATRVVLPVAFPGIFSALMVGLGRAVGETMIVLMAAGNTPIMDVNIFNGMRTLSANIAVELPEAPRDGTLYRVLFLSALTLFAMTLVVNTVAELVRQHYRKKTRQL